MISAYVFRKLTHVEQRLGEMGKLGLTDKSLEYYFN